MTESTCFCGEVLVGDHMDALVATGVGHFAAVHPEFGLTEVSVRNYFEGELRVDGPTDRLDQIGEIVIRPIAPTRRDDIIEFFDRRAFAGNPAWAMCYCMFHHVGGRYAGEWPHRTWQQNRSDLCERIEAGTTTGVVAYVDGELAGFCNASARSAFPARSDEDDEGIASIVCFVVGPPYRGHGVAAALLDGAVDLFAGNGVKIAEAYPVSEPEDSSAAYVGTLDMYRSAGFEVFSEDPLVVRKALA